MKKLENHDQTILIADDDTYNLKVVSKTLENIGYKVRVATDGQMAVKIAKSQPVDLVLLDIHMPKLDGYETCQALKTDRRTKDIPIIFVSGLDDAFNKVKGLELGAVDYLAKPIQLEEIKARVEVHLDLRNKVKELEEFNRIMLDREMRIIELKKEVNTFAIELGRERPYPDVWE